MTSLRHDAYDAGQLVAFALEPKRRPTKSDDYRRLLERFERERDFRQLVEEFCKGLRLVVLESGRDGLVLGCHADSVFATRLGDFRKGTGFEDRVAYGLVYLAIAAWCFPRPADLDEESRALPRVSPAEVATELVRWCGETDAGRAEDAVAGESEYREARRVILQRAIVRETESGRQGYESVQGMVEYALERLCEHGMMEEIREGEVKQYRSTERFRAQVREMAGHLLLEKIRALRGGLP
jgi:hypothetical protein